MRRRDLHLRAGGDGLSPSQRRDAILLPALAGIDAERADLLLHLPVVDVNGACERAFAQGGVVPTAAGAAAALFGGDPFLRPDLPRRLKRAGFAAIANFPSAQILDGDAARAVELVRYGLAADLRLLDGARAAGLAAIGFAFAPEAARSVVEAGAATVVVHPGVPTSDWRQRAALAATALQILASARHAGARRVLLYRPRGFVTALDNAAARFDGEVSIA